MLVRGVRGVRVCVCVQGVGSLASHLPRPLRLLPHQLQTPAGAVAMQVDRMLSLLIYLNHPEQAVNSASQWGPPLSFQHRNFCL